MSISNITSSLEDDCFIISSSSFSTASITSCATLASCKSSEISSETFGERIVDFYEAAINGYQWNQEHSHNIMNLMKFLRLSTNELKDEENEN